MKSPQLKNGYVRISTELLMAIIYRITNPTHLRLVLVTIRFTYGYNRKEFRTNVGSLATIVRLSTEYCRDMIHDMSDNSRIINVNWVTPKSLTISINKDYDEWRLD